MVRHQSIFVPVCMLSLLLIMLISMASAAWDGTTCTVITTPGTYQLSGNIQGTSGLTCIDIRSSDVLFEGNGHTLNGTTDNLGIGASASPAPISNVTVRNLTISHWDVGIGYENVTGGAIDNITVISSTGQGIQLITSSSVMLKTINASVNRVGIAIIEGSDFNTLTHVTASRNDAVGVWLYAARNNAILSGTFNQNNGPGVSLDGRSNNNTLSGNTANFNSDGIYLGANGNGFISAYPYGPSENNTITDNIARNNTGNGIFLFESANNNHITGNTFVNNSFGVHGEPTTGTISGNIFGNNNASFNTHQGISFINASGNTLTANNVFSNGEDGVILFNSSQNIIGYSNLTHNGHNGIYANNSHDNILFNNTATGNIHCGMAIELSTANSINNNTLINNADNGIYLASSSQNSASGNVARHNGNGIGLANSNLNNFTHNSLLNNTNNGIFLDASSQNRIINNYLNNTQNANSGLANIWNATKTARSNIIGGPYIGGNYWATPGGNGFSQTCSDGNRDGICDTAYTISPGNIDQLPLMIPPRTPSKIGVFRPSTHMFYLDFDGNGAWNGAVTDRAYNFGMTGDLPRSGDWNNNGKSEIGVFRNSTHMFYLDFDGNGAWNGAVTDRAYNFGTTGDLPVSGDWNNDGIHEIGVFRPSTHMFYLDYNGNGAWNGGVADRAYNFGTTGDLPVSGDWNNDGIHEIGVFRPSTHMFYLDYNGNGAWNGAVTDRAYNFGMTGDIPTSGKW